MTIALGLVAKDGLVIAADTQETIAGYWKYDQGKILECGRSLLEIPKGGGAVCLVAGAGRAAYVDGISHALIRRFRSEPYLSKANDVQPAFAMELEAFHTKHVLPFAAYPRDDRPAFQLIVGYQYSNGVGELLTSEDSLIQHQSFYAAIGAGSLLATTLLGRWYQLPLLDVWQTTLLAAYVMYLVKDSIDGCGKHTDLVCVPRNMGAVRISRKDALALENVFGDYSQSVEPAYLRSLLSAPPPNRSVRISACRRKLKRIINAVASRAAQATGTSATTSFSDQT